MTGVQTCALPIYTLAHWRVPKEYADPIYNYLIHGFEPGSFFSAVFANDFMSAMLRSHPANTVEALKTVSGWILNKCPPEAFGSYNKVSAWLTMSPSQRRQLLEEWNLVYTEQEEIMLALRNTYTNEPVLY